MIEATETTPILRQIQTDLESRQERPIETFDNIPRPCYYMLRVLGVWQPQNTCWLMRIYTNYFIWVFWLAFIVLTALQNYFTVRSVFQTERFYPHLVRILILCSPLLFLRYYFTFGDYNGLILHFYENSDSDTRKSLKKSRHIYTAITVVMWVFMSVFYCIFCFTSHWQAYWKGKFWLFLVENVLIIYTMGWWAIWFSLYGFVCHIHHQKFILFRKYMVKTFDNNDSSSDNIIQCEISKSAHLLFKFNDLESILHRTQRDFSKIISIAVASHIADIFYCGWVTFMGKCQLWEYCGILFHDLVSIFIKLFPAALVCHSLHMIIVVAGDMCTLGPDKRIPYARLDFFHHLSFREHSIGLSILGVKITPQITAGIFLTVGSTLVTFLRTVIVEYQN